MQIFRQGDILIRRISRAPKGQRKIVADGILAHGEVTGHAHRISDATLAELYDLGEGKFLSVTGEGLSIRHDEHDPINLPIGEYEVVRQVEYSPEEIRNVAD